MLLSSKNLNDDDQNIEQKKNYTLLLVYKFFNCIIVTNICAQKLNLTI